jgi:hypothetical protein
MRASDAERERAVARLRDAAAAGRLTIDELDERTAVAYAARTVGELTAPRRVRRAFTLLAPERGGQSSSA